MLRRGTKMPPNARSQAKQRAYDAAPKVKDAAPGYVSTILQIRAMVAATRTAGAEPTEILVNADALAAFKQDATPLIVVQCRIALEPGVEAMFDGLPMRLNTSEAAPPIVVRHAGPD